MTVKFGPAGLGGVKEAISNLEIYSKLGLRACEIAFTYSIYIKEKQDAIKIGKAAKKYGIKLSIHAPYWINLNSEDKEKVRKSRERILKCCEVATWLGAYRIVFHPGYPGKDRKKAYEKIKKEILTIQKEIKKRKYTPKLAPETTGKVNGFGTIDEIYRLYEETDCEFCIDFAHILARYKSYNFEEVFKKFRKAKKFHLHFSGITYGEKGEKHHKKTARREWKKLLENLPENKDIVIINESPSPVQDSVEGLIMSKIYF
jgi:deoxyribonuclease-4